MPSSCLTVCAAVTTTPGCQMTPLEGKRCRPCTATTLWPTRSAMAARLPESSSKGFPLGVEVSIVMTPAICFVNRGFARPASLRMPVRQAETSGFTMTGARRPRTTLMGSWRRGGLRAAFVLHDGLQPATHRSLVGQVVRWRPTTRSRSPSSWEGRARGAARPRRKCCNAICRSPEHPETCCLQGLASCRCRRRTRCLLIVSPTIIQAARSAPHPCIAARQLSRMHRRPVQSRLRQTSGAPWPGHGRRCGKGA
ncbi:hypothetical protein D3C72_1538500 [compost metagenome]